MAEITKQDVEHVARLARLELTEEEKSKFTQELGEVLNYANELGLADTKGIETISQVSGIVNRTRPDEITSIINGGDLIRNAPARENGYIKVKKVFD